MKKILIVFGTRPEAIKMAPLVKEFEKFRDEFDLRVCVTAQHRQMLDQVLDFFNITPDYDLDLMKPNQTLHSVMSDILLGLEPILDDFKPDFVLVHGDTITSTSAAIAAYFSRCKVGHVEAGLRTWDKLSPFPEEMNRQITGRLADIHFAPTAQSFDNLLRENVKKEDVLVTGNTVIDALLYSVQKVNSDNFYSKEIVDLKSILKDSMDYILVTGHRRENFGNGFENICKALKEIAEHYKNIKIIYPVHLNPNVQEPVRRLLAEIPNVHLVQPLSYPAFVWAMNNAKIILTDSGGVQEEAPSLGKPVLVMRDTTERPEAIIAGTAILVGTDCNIIVREVIKLLSNKDEYNKMSCINNPYGDGLSSKKIVEYLRSL